MHLQLIFLHGDLEKTYTNTTHVFTTQATRNDDEKTYFLILSRLIQCFSTAKYNH